MEKRIEPARNFADIYPTADSVALDAMLEQPKSFRLDFDGRGHALEKVASCQQGTHIPPELERVIRAIQAAPDPEKVYLYDRALGAGEHFGANNNGDWFGRAELVKNHGTFVTDGALYRHHKSRGPKTGDVMASAYNEPLDTVDLILSAPKEALEDDIQTLNDGGIIATSMGARVKHDICSICGNKARSRGLYCNHLKREMLRIYPDGRQVCAKNPNPIFKDISIVIIRAAPESVVIRKIASLQKRAQRDKAAEIEKEVGSINDTRDMFAGESRSVVDPAVIDATNHLGRADALQTLHEAKGTLRPDEFQAVMQKDASCLRPDIVPYVAFEKTGSDQPEYIGGKSFTKIASAISRGRGIPTEGKLCLADFLNRHEKKAYLRYRKAIGFDRRFMR